MIVETYPIALKKFMKFTKTKSVTLAERIGYDVSYISKWINGAKLPSSRAIERVNEDAAALFAETIEKLDRREDCCRYFSFPDTTEDLTFAISDYLSRAYRTSLQSGRTEKSKKSWPVRIVTSHQKAAHFLKDLFRKKIPTLTGKEELVIYGEFFDFYDDGFWSYLDVPSHYKRLRIRIGLDKEKLRRHPKYVTRLYAVLNRFMDAEFTFYDFSALSDANLIILKDQFVIQYSLQSHRGMMMCSYIDDPAVVHDIYERFGVHHTPKLLTHIQSPWNDDYGYRTSFYETSRFCFFLTNGIEYLLPQEVFDRLIAESPADRAGSIERLRITWEEIIAKARVSIIVPTPSFMRYLETGHIDLTDVQYTLTPSERIEHLKVIARTLTQSQGITLGTMHLSPAFLSYKEANLSFYSNYRMSFFKKNTLAMNSQTDPFYIIVDKELDAMVRDYFDNMTKAPYYQPCSAQELESKTKIYQHMLEKITSLAGA